MRKRYAGKRAVLTAYLLAIVAGHAAAADRIVLPPTIYATPGVPVSVYIHDAVLAEPSDKLSFEATSDFGATEPAVRWTVTPTPSDVGDHSLSMRLTGSGDDTSAATVVRVVPADAGADRDMALLIVGDSLTHASRYPNEIARLLSRPGNPNWRMLGTHRPGAVSDGVAHEGYGGWTWARFNAQFDASNTQVGKLGNSPFVFATADGSGHQLDVARYLREQCAGGSPDFVIFMLGINDCFGADPDDPAAMDARIESTLTQAEILLAAFREAAPSADLGVCLTPAPNARDAAFEANYKGKYPRGGWRRIQQRLVEIQIAQFRDREDEHIYIVPTSLCVDPVGGYPENNAVHPNAAGYQQIGGSIYAWLKWRLSQQ